MMEKMEAVKTVKVACGVIFRENRIFLCRRKEGISMGGFWEFPGGKLEEGENPEACLKRELKEELNMDVDVLEHYKTVEHDYGTFRIELISLICAYRPSDVHLTDHDRYEWVDAEGLMDFTLAPADRPIAGQLAEGRGK